MPCREITRSITDVDNNTHEYYVRQKPASEGEQLKFTLLSMLGPSMSLLSGLKLREEEEDQSSVVPVFFEALSAIFERNKPEEVFIFMQKLVLNITRDGVRITVSNFDEMYTDNTLEFYKACALVLEVNFARFFAGLQSPELRAMKDVVQSTMSTMPPTR